MKKLHVNSWALYQKCMDEATCKVAVDAGANDGGYTETLRNNGFFVYAFEPVPTMYEKIVTRHGKDPNCFLSGYGLSDRHELIHNVTVLENWTIGKPGMGGLSTKPEMIESDNFDVAATTLDCFFCGRRVGLIKLDVDGYEFKVLRGAEKTLRRWKPPILCEFGKYIAALGESPEEFVRFIFDLGYNVVSMDGWNTFTSWEEIQPQYPYDSTFDVMLMPR